ncbi:MAG: hypothetical protein CVU71_04895 [Deltaproteobacteria bacterium HGW-Deltaproteobacteria-6]|jgi:hypothetical protein|nr:MAG: hypothetical protein CVU71_04895 [Deltaproteobacteria bacterium HGW-Deltaproteobacteria-6]
MEIILGTQIAVPLSQVALLLGISTVTLFFGRIKVALIINYCFTLYWGFFLNPGFFSDNGDLILNNYTFAYFGFGLLIVVLAVIGFMFSKE